MSLTITGGVTRYLPFSEWVTVSLTMSVACLRISFFLRLKRVRVI